MSSGSEYATLLMLDSYFLFTTLLDRTVPFRVFSVSRASVAMRPLDQLKRHKIVFEYQTCRNIFQVARKLSTSRETVRTLVACYENTRGVLTARSLGHEAFKSGHAKGLNAYAGLTHCGMTKPQLVAGASKMASTFAKKKGYICQNITNAEYEVVVMRTLLPHGKGIMGSQGITSWVLQQDNDQTHKKASAQP